MHDEERPALEQAPEEDLDLEGAKTTVLSTPYGETTGVRRPPVLSAPTPDDAAGRAPAPAAASADDIVADVVALTPDYAVSADDAPGSAAPAPDAAATPVKSGIELFREEFEAGYTTPARELFPYEKTTLFSEVPAR